MAIEIHVTMQDTNDIDTRAGQPEEEKMRTGGIFLVALAYLVARPSSLRFGSDGFDGGLNLTDLKLRLINTPMFDGVVPNFVQIGLGARRKGETCHGT
jgi:hypothetical protein